MRTTTQCASIGYQQKSIEELCDLLLGHDVERLIDVRAAAWSQRPQYRRTALAWCLAQAGIEYVHYKAAGNPFRPRKGEVLSFDKCATQYAEYIAQNPAVLKDLRLLMLEKPSAVFCYERDTMECHRSILLQALIEDDPSLQVIEL